MAKTPANLLSLLHKALNSQLGVVVKTNDAGSLRQKLYPVRKTDNRLANLSFVISPENGKDLWIINKGNKNAS